ncbi:MAG: SpoIID/LytB domain-containing protein, partial [Bacteroidia bacterium]|nr:SpoIID/LytB domain-containing protein [Bacteroidia bacterium]
VRAEKDSLILQSENNIVAKGKKIYFKALEPKSAVKIKPVEPLKAVRIFGDDIEFLIINNQIKIFNRVSIEEYVSGVVESEVGTKAPFEYYKVQSILCRTYALSHIRRHEADSFNLCDGVHCQAYFGKQNRSQQIEKATFDTRNKVIVDSQNQLIIAAFHSNSGGLTVNSEDVWNGYKNYLRSVPDSFSLQGRNATWKKSFTKQEWLNYFQKKYKLNTNDSNYSKQLYSYVPAGREIYFIKTPKVFLKDMRTDLNLKSTYFNVTLQNDTVVLTGLGYGHGVGLSQEGAIQMAKLGYSYKDIIQYYYKNVTLIDLHMFDFFKE